MTTNQLSALHVVGAVTIALATPGDLHAILDLVDAYWRPRCPFHKSYASIFGARQGVE